MVMCETPEVLEALDEIESAAAELCGQRNAVTTQLIELVARLDVDDLWESTGARSLEHWVAWKCGMSNGHAAELWPWSAAVTSCRRPWPGWPRA